MRTSTARANNWECPNCHSPTSRDEEGRGFVWHLQKILDDTGRSCEHERGMRDEVRFSGQDGRVRVAEHTVSTRNGSQVMVKGMNPSLRALGYKMGARIRVLDVSGDPERDTWEFVVANDEDATLVSKSPPPPAWLVPGVLVRIEVAPPELSQSALDQPPETKPEQKKLPPWLVKLGAWLAHHAGQILVAVITTLILAYFGLKK